MDALQLTIYDFDNMENHDALYVSERKIFVDDKNGTAHWKVGEYLRAITHTPYLGWDRQVYSKFVVEEIKLN